MDISFFHKNPDFLYSILNYYYIQLYKFIFPNYIIKINQRLQLSQNGKSDYY
jgi:hypothetical protein